MERAIWGRGILKNALQAILIVMLSIAAAVFYGIVHDQITARICVEYL